ncbi:MAG: hypothetical protein KAS13_08255 [Candidatus Omnitrophica bacterium]|nr:hypothetical protein [Candidatus Omnitrophota bacterium]
MQKTVKIMSVITICSLFFAGCFSSGYSTSKLVKEIKNSEHFKKEVVEYSETVAVMFYTVACVTCREIKPLIGELGEKWQNKIKIVTVNCRTNTDLVMEYEIHAVPRFIFFKNGEKLTEPLSVKDEDALFALFEEHS